MKVPDVLRGDFGSHPSEQDLVLAYLQPWLQSGAGAGAGGVACEFLHEADVYAEEPGELTQRFRPAIATNGDKAWYFISPLRSKAQRGQRKVRAVATGEGSWHSEHAMKPVTAGIERCRQIGWRQSLSFVTREDGQKIRSGWLMVEIRLLNEGPGTEVRPGELVLCKVYRSPRSPVRSPTKPPAAAASSTGGKRKADHKNPGEARRVRLCTRCRIEAAESQSDTDDDDTEATVDDHKPQGRSGSGVLQDDDSMTGESSTPRGDEAVDESSENRGGPSTLKLHKFL